MPQGSAKSKVQASAVHVKHRQEGPLRRGCPGFSFNADAETLCDDITGARQGDLEGVSQLWCRIQITGNSLDSRSELPLAMGAHCVERFIQDHETTGTELHVDHRSEHVQRRRQDLGHICLRSDSFAL